MKTKLAQRVKRARAAAEFAAILKRNKNGQPTVIQVPGHSGKRYEQFIRRNDHRKSGLTVECQLETGFGHILCPGNSNGTICYHSIAAIEVVVKDCSMKVSWCQTKEIADKLARLGGRAYPVYSWNGTGILYAVIKEA